MKTVDQYLAQITASQWVGRPSREEAANDYAHALAVELLAADGLTRDTYPEYLDLVVEIEIH